MKKFFLLLISFCILFLASIYIFYTNALDTNNEKIIVENLE